MQIIDSSDSCKIFFYNESNSLYEQKENILAYENSLLINSRSMSKWFSSQTMMKIVITMMTRVMP
jgi:hypothetical protein